MNESEYAELQMRAQVLKESVPMEYVIEAVGGEVHDHGGGGKWVKTTCPFHGDKHPSAGISRDSLYFVCPACSVRGDIFAVLQKGKVVKSFPEAIEWVEELAQSLGVSTTDNS